MKINKILFQNFRIYKGNNEIIFSPNASKNISIIAGKNGFGKTTFLTSLIWVFYGKMMSEVEDKYRKDIKNAGGYEKFLKTLLNRDVKSEFESNNIGSPTLSVEIELKDLLIPSIPCKSVVLKRSYDLRTETEDLKIFIDAQDKIKLKRRIKRDNEERGYDLQDVMYRWKYNVKPTYEEFIRPHKRSCDIVIPNNHHFEKGLQVIVSYLKSHA